MPLPFGLKLKRTRRYTVSSKSCLVARIQLLDNEFVEFTLSVESTGQESLEAVAQRLELREITYFSLWYYNKQNQRRWVDLDKPLKKQLDKYALEPTVYFGVVFYVPTVSQLQQEITRYQYYLQLKKDILEGNIPCTLEQAIHLAGLAVQADFGDFDQYESQDFLQRFALFPVGWLQDEKVLEEATQKVALLHQKYRGLTPPDAEMLYMQEVERMDGYGEESYPAKDSQGSDICIGACLDGIFVKHKNGRPPVIFSSLQAGPLTRVTICKDKEGKPKPFGFVCFKHQESVSYAIALLNGIRLYGRPINVQYRSGSSHSSELNIQVAEKYFNINSQIYRNEDILSRSFPIQNFTANDGNFTQEFDYQNMQYPIYNLMAQPSKYQTTPTLTSSYSMLSMLNPLSDFDARSSSFEFVHQPSDLDFYLVNKRKWQLETSDSSTEDDIRKVRECNQKYRRYKKRKRN